MKRMQQYRRIAKTMNGKASNSYHSPRKILRCKILRRGAADGKGASVGFAECPQDASCRDEKAGSYCSLTVYHYYRTLCAVFQGKRESFFAFFAGEKNCGAGGLPGVMTPSVTTPCLTTPPSRRLGKPSDSETPPLTQGRLK